MIEYLRDIDLPAPGEWSSGALLDPMHPSHGPLPQLFGLVACEGEQFTVALWDNGDQLLTFLEMLKEEDPDERAPMMPMKEAHRMHGWIAQTYRWCQDEDTMVCSGHRVHMPDYPGLKEESIWMREIYRLVMMESVAIAAEGTPLTGLHRLLSR